MSENSSPSTAGSARPGRHDAHAAADAFGATGAFDTSGHDHDASRTTNEDDAPGAPGALAARWLSRLPGTRQNWTLGGLAAGGILLGSLLSGGIAWKMISSRDAAVSAHTVRLDTQSNDLVRQAELIEVLKRAVRERPLPDDPAPGAGIDAADNLLSAPVVPSASPPDKPVTAVMPASPPPSAPATVATAQVSAPVPAAPAVRTMQPQRLDTTAASRSGVSPDQAGGGICDVPSGRDGATRMRKCIEWFAGQDKGGTRAVP
jgi:hypothetical protein